MIGKKKGKPLLYSFIPEYFETVDGTRLVQKIKETNAIVVFVVRKTGKIEEISFREIKSDLSNVAETFKNEPPLDSIAAEVPVEPEIVDPFIEDESTEQPVEEVPKEPAVEPVEEPVTPPPEEPKEEAVLTKETTKLEIGSKVLYNDDELGEAAAFVDHIISDSEVVLERDKDKKKVVVGSGKLIHIII